MGKRIASERQHVSPPQTEIKSQSDRSARKRKRSAAKASRVEKCQRLSAGSTDNSCDWHENDDEDSSASSVSNSETLMQTPQQPPRAQCPVNSRASLLSLATFASGGHSDHNNSSATDSPRPVYTLRPSVVNGTILRDVLSKAWRLGRPIGKGNFGEIFLASDDTVCPVSSENAKYVVKIEPHSNGPLFVEIHCLINTNQAEQIENGSEDNKIETLPPRIRQGPPSGIPNYIASGTHYFGEGRYRFLVIPRFDRDLHSLIKNARVAQKTLLVLAIHIINVLEHLHDKGYCHNDIKAQNLMISKCKYLRRQAVHGAKSYDEHYEEKQQTTDSGNSSEQETNDDDYFIKNEKFPVKRLAVMKAEINYAEDEDEDFDDGATTNSNNSNSMDMYHTPQNKNKRRMRNAAVEFSGSNPMRSCRRNDTHNSSSMYEEMVKSHYLRPSKRVSYIEFFNEDGHPIKADNNSEQQQSPPSSDNEWDEFVTPSARRASNTAAAKRSARSSACNQKTTRATRRHTEQKQQELQQQQQQQLQLKSELNDTGRNGNVRTKRPPVQYQLVPVVEEHIFLIDFGLASKYQDRGVHRPFIMDQRRAHDGTLEFTSRDAHLGAHSRRSDLECLGYNLLYWSEGYLPWKDVAQQQQQEKVHRAKELFMTDVCEMLRQFYGKQVPKYLGEFLQQIGQLAYQERPNYERYRNIFKREYRRLGHDCAEMRLSSDEIQRTRISIKDEVDGNAKCDIFELNNKIACNVMRCATLSTPFQEHSLTNRVSPKNLRSKSDKRNAKKKKFSWAEVLSQDPDQIARERAVKEFEREEVICPLQSRLPRRYEGRPTYAIMAVEQCRRVKGHTVQEHNSEEAVEQYVKDNAPGAEDTYNDEDDDDDEEEEEEEEDEEEHGDEDEDDIEEEQDDEEDDEEEMDIDEQQRDTASSGRKRGRPRKESSQVQQLVKGIGSRTRTTSSRSKNGTHSSHSSSSHNSQQSHGITPLTAVGGNKRGCATRKENATVVASATGEEVVEHNKLKSNRPAAVEVDVNVNQSSKQRRPRRCLYKTETQLRGEHQDVENNSNYATSMYGAWHYDDENSYGKGRNVQTSRHCRK